VVKIEFERLVKKDDIGRKEVVGRGDVQVQQYVAEVVENGSENINGERKEQEFGVKISRPPTANQIPGEDDSRRSGREAVSNIAPLQADVRVENQDDRQIQGFCDDPSEVPLRCPPLVPV
jgi:hypothetical protein